MNTKTLKTFALAALMSLGLTASPAPASPANPSDNSVAKKIQNAIRLPEELKSTGFTQKVKVSFVTNAKGEVEAVAANTKNLLLRQNVEQQFKALSFTELPAGTYNVELDFIVY